MSASRRSVPHRRNCLSRSEARWRAQNPRGSLAGFPSLEALRVAHRSRHNGGMDGALNAWGLPAAEQVCSPVKPFASCLRCRRPASPEGLARRDCRAIATVQWHRSGSAGDVTMELILMVIGDQVPELIDPLQNLPKTDLLGSPPPPALGAAPGTKTPGFPGPIATRFDGFCSEGHIANRDRKPFPTDGRSDALVFFWLPALPIGFGSVSPSMDCHIALRQDCGSTCLVVFSDLLVVGKDELQDRGIEISDTGPYHRPLDR